MIEMISKFQAFSISLLTLALFSSSPEASAQTRDSAKVQPETKEKNTISQAKNPNLAKGKQLFKQKKFKEAKHYFEKALKEQPKSWQAHFYLAHTMMALGKVQKAEHHYKMSKHVTDHPAVHAHCDKALESVDEYYARYKPKAKPVTAESSEETEVPSYEDKRKAEVEAKKAKILKEAQKQCAKIRQDAETQINHEKSISQRRFRYPDGTVGTDISDERRKEIRDEAERKCRSIMDSAESRARGYR